MSCAIGPYTITRGEILDYKKEAGSPQAAEECLDGDVYVAERGFDTLMFHVKLHDERALLEEVFDYIRHGVRFKAVPFTYVDGRGTSWTVRYWGRQIIPIIDEGIMASMVLKLRKEV